MRDSIVLVIGALSGIIAGAVKAFTYESWHMYSSAVVGMFLPVSQSIVRSVIAENTPPADLSEYPNLAKCEFLPIMFKLLGKSFALLPAIQLFAPFLTLWLYMLIYTNFTPPHVYPSPVWFLSSVLCGGVIISAFWMDRRLRSPKLLV